MSDITLKASDTGGRSGLQYKISANKSSFVRLIKETHCGEVREACDWAIALRCVYVYVL